MLALLAAAAQQAMSPVDLAGVAEAIRDSAIAIVSVLGLIIAYCGLQTWRRQLRGNTEYDLARRLLRASFKMRDALRTVRNPFMVASEIADALKEAGVSQEEIEKSGCNLNPDVAVYNTRWKTVAEALSDLKVEALEAEVLWGSAAIDSLKPLYDSVAKLRLALVRLLRQGRRDRPPLKPDEADRIDGIIYDTSEGSVDDEFTVEVHAAIERVKALVKPKLKI